MVANDNARELDKRGALESIAGKPAPTVSRDSVKNLFIARCFPFLESRLSTIRYNGYNWSLEIF
jgi:hypothetical protein